MRRLVGEYYFLLRSVLATRAHLRPCLKRCRQCRIFFLTDPRNRGRSDLGCPFGCRDAHRQKRSTERSQAYNRSPSGKLKKKLQNEKRKSGRRARPQEEPPGEAAPTAAPDPSEFATAVLEYVRLVTGLIEGRRVGRDEILQMLRRAVRQRSLARERRLDYVLRTLKEKPP